MNWLLLILAGVLYGSGTAVLRAGTRRRTNTWGLSLAYGLVPAVIATIVGMPHLSAIRFDLGVWSVVLGLLVIVSMWATAEALRHGPVCPIFLIRSGSISFPVAASILIYDEPLGIYRVLGLATAAVALVLLARTPPGQSHHDNQRQKTWVAWALLSLFSMGGVQLIMRDAVSREVSREFLLAFIMLTFWGNVIAATVGLAISRQKPTRTDMLWGTPVGLTSLVGFTVSMFVLRDMGGVLVFPSRFLITATVVILSGFLLFKEKPNRRTAVGMVLGVIGIVLLAIK